MVFAYLYKVLRRTELAQAILNVAWVKFILEFGNVTIANGEIIGPQSNEN